MLVVGSVDGDRDVLDDLESIVEGALEGLDDDDGVDVALELRKGKGQDFTSCRKC